MKVMSIRVSFKDKLAFGTLVPLEFLLTKKACYLKALIIASLIKDLPPLSKDFSPC
jgi:hypothetical protein